MEEIWKDVDGFEGLYLISTYGRVKSLITDKILKPVISSNKYFQVFLRKDGKTYNFLIHRLMCMNFIPNPNSLPQVNHIDYNRSNNRLDNLEWCTSRYNNEYSGTFEKGTESTRKKVIQSTKSGEIINSFESSVAAGRETGLNSSSIRNCCLGLLKTYKGFIWRYVNE